MQPGSEYEMIRQKLEDLDSRAITSNWDKRDAWKRLESRLPEKRKKTIPLWLATSAAAALLILGLMLGRMTTPASQLSAMRQISRPAPPAVIPENHQTDTAFITKNLPPVPNSPHPIVTGIPASDVKVQEETPVAEEQAFVTKEHVTARDSAPVTIFKQNPISAPTVVYTLNEIMDHVPEKEAPSQHYSGIFKLRPLPENVQESAAREAMMRAKFEQTHKID